MTLNMIHHNRRAAYITVDKYERLIILKFCSVIHWHGKKNYCFALGA